ncbi:fasciclin-1 [Caerostris extrusa]|uniref:Fasciclin-1 n=1 Tax=Caerostris extrusa TaxID=172846 RepID=A0AAV4NVL7_CAEEX|nr:fasciclin-1 [Caerostris extrusa]
MDMEAVFFSMGMLSDWFGLFQEMVNRDEVLRKLLQYWPVTVFAPTNDAIEKSNEWIVGRENKVVSYHVLNQLAEKKSFPFKSPTSLAGSPPLYLAVKEGPWKIIKKWILCKQTLLETTFIIQTQLRFFQLQPSRFIPPKLTPDSQQTAGFPALKPINCITNATRAGNDINTSLNLVPGQF